MIPGLVVGFLIFAIRGLPALIEVCFMIIEDWRRQRQEMKDHARRNERLLENAVAFAMGFTMNPVNYCQAFRRPMATDLAQGREG